MHCAPAPLTQLFLVDDEGVVFSRQQQKLFALNTTACFIWICLEMQLEPERITEKYCETFSVDTQHAQSVIKHITGQWETLGLVVTEGQVADSGPPAESAPTTEHASVPCTSEHNLPLPWSEATYVLLGSAIRVQYMSRDSFLCAHPALRHLQADAPTDSPERLISILETGHKFHLVRDGRCEGVADSLNFLTARLKGLVLQTAINNFDYQVYLHAGVVERNGTCILLPATAGSGKSTLTAALIRHGYHYLSDEVALLGDKGFRVAPVPISIGLKSGSWEVLEPLYPELPDLRIHDREDGKKVRYLPPPEDVTVKSNSFFPVKTIIFPNYDPSSETCLAPVTRVETLHRLFDDCLAIRVDLTIEQVENLVNWIQSVDCYRLTMHDLDEAVTQVTRTQDS